MSKCGPQENEKEQNARHCVENILINSCTDTEVKDLSEMQVDLRAES